MYVGKYEQVEIINTVFYKYYFCLESHIYKTNKYNTCSSIPLKPCPFNSNIILCVYFISHEDKIDRN